MSDDKADMGDFRCAKVSCDCGKCDPPRLSWRVSSSDECCCIGTGKATVVVIDEPTA